MDGEPVGGTRLKFGKTLFCNLQGLVLAIERDAKFVRSGRERSVEVQRFAAKRDGKRGRGDKLLIREDGERRAVDRRRDFNREASSASRSRRAAEEVSAGSRPPEVPGADSFRTGGLKLGARSFGAASGDGTESTADRLALSRCAR